MAQASQPVQRRRADAELLKSVNKSHKSDVVDSKSKLIPLDEFIQGILKYICKQTETNKIDKLYIIFFIKYYSTNHFVNHRIGYILGASGV